MTGAASGGVERWVLRRHARPGAPLRLLCLPHAGGDTWMFADWHLRLPPSVDVCPVRLPGRGSRMADPPADDLDDLVAALAEGVAGLLDRPFAVFGHSMGALIGLALLRVLKRDRGLDAALLCAAACRAPHAVRLQPAISHLPGHLLMEAMERRFGPRGDLAANPELVRLMLPTLRADLGLCERFEPDAPPLGCPIVAYAGRDDASMGGGAVEGWEGQTTGPFRLHTLEGGHFFPVDGKAELLPVLAEDLAWAAS